WPAKHDLSRLRLLGSVGEAINPEAWMWYRERIGGNRCPIVDTWWQTETGSIVISPLPGITAATPGSATTPLPGHRAALLSARGAHRAVAEAAVVGRAHDLKGQAIAAFVTLREGFKYDITLRDELRQFVVEKIGAIARPDDILFSADLPKTRSGKIMRRLLRDIAEGRALGDTTTLADPNVVASLKEQYEEREG